MRNGRTWRGRIRRSDDTGFSVLEVSAAVGVLGLVIAIMSGALASGLNAALHAKVAQQATALATETIEHARSRAYGDLLVDSATLSEPGCTSKVTGSRYDPDDGGPLGAEDIAAESWGTIDCETVRTIGATTYSVVNLITWADADPADGSGAHDLKRVIVDLTWERAGRTYHHHASTTIAPVARGADVATLQLAPKSQTLTVAQGGPADFAVSVAPLASGRAFDLSVDLPSGWSASFFHDRGTVGVYDPSLDEELTDSDYDLVPDTGPVVGVEDVLVRIQPPATASGSRTLTLTADDGQTRSTAELWVVI